MTGRVVVVGGGYAGVLAAIRLGRQGFDTTLVDPKSAFVEKIRLHQLAAGQPLPERRYEDILAGTARFVQGRAVRIDRDRREVHLEDGVLPYDRLLLAAGSEPGPVPDGALAIADPASATQLAADIAALPSGKTVAVVGTGLTGVETATEIAEGRADLRVLLVGPNPADDLGPGGDVVHRALDRLGITWVDGLAERLDGASIVVDGRPVPADVVVWAASLRPARWLGTLGLSLSADGAVLVDEHLRSSDPNIYVAGDAAAVVLRGHRARMACASAMPMGAHASSAIAADLAGKAPPPFRFGWIIRCVSLGRSDGLILRVDRDDHPTGAWRGTLAAWSKELICRYTVGSFQAERLGVGYQWLRSPEA